jgi:hypothetical protein
VITLRRSRMLSLIPYILSHVLCTHIGKSVAVVSTTLKKYNASSCPQQDCSRDNGLMIDGASRLKLKLAILLCSMRDLRDTPQIVCSTALKDLARHQSCPRACLLFAMPRCYGAHLLGSLGNIDAFLILSKPAFIHIHI